MAHPDDPSRAVTGLAADDAVRLAVGDRSDPAALRDALLGGRAQGREVNDHGGTAAVSPGARARAGRARDLRRDDRAAGARRVRDCATDGPRVALAAPGGA